MRRMSKKSPSDSSSTAIELREKAYENRFAKMNEKEEFSKPSPHGAARAGKRERAFELSLPALVTGVDALDNKFREKTQVISISSEEATVWLRSRVTPGSKLDLALDIPKTLILENHFKLRLSGTVILMQNDSARPGKKQLVSVRLDRKFRLLPIPPSIN
jgi:hypothetical protein